MSRLKAILSGMFLWLFVMAVAVPANAATVLFTVSLSGPAESPANASPGTGVGQVIFDTVAHTLQVDVSFSGLTGTTTASHIHCCTAVPGVSTAIVATETPFFNSFPIGVTSGTYSHLFDMTAAGSYNPAFVTANGGTIPSAEAALLAGAIAGKAYLNIHSSTFGGGEIRGFLIPAVPEPTSLALIGLGLAGIIGYARRTRR